MSLTLIPQPPPVPSGDWLSEFADLMTALRPGLPADNAMRSALLAYPGAWLLDPYEAVTLWLAAIENASRSTRRGLTG